jgi:hypothetical protein
MQIAKPGFRGEGKAEGNEKNRKSRENKGSASVQRHVSDAQPQEGDANKSFKESRSVLWESYPACVRRKRNRNGKLIVMMLTAQWI